MFWKSVLLLTFVVVLINIYSSVDAKKHAAYCESNSTCQAIHPNDDAKGIYSSCLKSSEKKKAAKFCATVYVKNPDINRDATAKNPEISGTSSCEHKPVTDASCLKYAKANSPFMGTEGGKMYANCYVKAKGYLCSAPKDADEQYMTCSIQANKCATM